MAVDAMFPVVRLDGNVSPAATAECPVWSPRLVYLAEVGFLSVRIHHLVIPDRAVATFLQPFQSLNVAPHFLSPVIPSQYPSANTSRINTISIQFTARPPQLMSIAARTAVPTLRVMSICTLMRPELARATRTIASAVRNDMYCASHATSASSSTA
jgi:hypothetical protein